MTPSDDRRDDDRALPDEWRVPSLDRLAPGHPHYEEILARHEQAIRHGRNLYEDPGTGLWVMTAEALAARRCCKNGCRHCPHPEEPRSGPEERARM